MEVREPVHSPPFWASASNASNPSPTNSYSSSSSTQSGIRPWIIVLVFSIVVLLFLPSILSTPSKSGRFSLSIKSGWDVLNLCLVVFAILCGVLGRIGDGSGSESGSYKQPRSEWTGFSNPMGEVNRAAGMRRTRNSSSYPDLRLETDVWGQNRVPDSWRFFDDVELYRNRRPVQLYGVSGQGEEERECRAIPVDTERFPQLERVDNETNFLEVKMESDTIYEEKKGSEAMGIRRRRRSLEALPKWEEVQNEPMVTVGRRRRRSLERFPSIEEVEKEANFQNVEVQAEEEVDKPQMAVRTRGKSLENFPKMNEIEEETKLEEEMVEKESESARKAKSSEELPEIEEVKQDTNFEENVVEKPPLVVEVAPPPPPPPPPPLPETKVAEECRKHKRSGSAGGAKDLASAITHFYQKKKQGNKSKRKEKYEVSIEPNPNSNSTTEGNSNPSTAALPPPPSPPPSSIFYKFLSSKKAGSKSRKIHSLSASTHSSSPSTVNTISTSSPPPPPPQPPHQGLHRSRKDQVASLGYRRIEDTELYEYRRRERSNVSSYVNYPLPPRSPLPPAPPPPPPPPSVRENVSESRDQEVQKNGSVAVFCASPDVNDKADLFIKRFRDGLKMEIINSSKEKEKRKERQEREDKLGAEDHDGIHI